jgi:hypothetical protein
MINVNVPYVKRLDKNNVVLNSIENMPGKKYPGKLLLGFDKDKYGNEIPVFMPGRRERRQIDKLMFKGPKTNNRKRTAGRNFKMIAFYPESVHSELVSLKNTNISRINPKLIKEAYNLNKIHFKKLKLK